MDLAKTAGKALSTITDFERGARKPRANSMTAIRAALEAAGIVFIEGDNSIGVVLHLRDPGKK